MTTPTVYHSNSYTSRYVKEAVGRAVRTNQESSNFHKTWDDTVAGYEALHFIYVLGGATARNHVP